MRVMHPRLIRLALGAALLGLLAWIYRGAATAELVNWDDDRFFAHNRLFAAGGWTYISAAFSQIQFEAYQPLHLLSYLPDRYLWPNWPPGFHLLNLGLFAIDLLVLWRLVRRYTSDLAAFVAIAVFALHPLCVEPVSWITDRKDLLMLLWFLLALGREDHRAGPRPGLAPMALYLCALLTKSSSVCFPIVLFAWLFWVCGRPLREAILRSAAYAVAAVAVSVFVFVVWSDHAMVAEATAGEHIVDVAASAVTFAGHVIWPVDLAPIYPDEIRYPAAAVIGCLLALVALAVSWRRLASRARFAAVAACGALLPVSNIVPMTLRFADRYLLLALALLTLPLASLLDGLVDCSRANARRAVIAIAAVVAAIAGLEARASAELAPTWQTPHALWTHAVAAQPQAYLTHMKLAETLEAEHDWQPAFTQLRLAEKLHSDDVFPRKRTFMLHVDRAEANGVIPAGSTVRWVSRLDHALPDRTAFQQLADEVNASPCKGCSTALLAIDLLTWPRPDADLLAAAEQAINQQAWEHAYLYLSQVRDHSLPQLDQLARRIVNRQ